MQPSGSTRPAPGAFEGVFVHTTAPVSRAARSMYTSARLRRRAHAAPPRGPRFPPAPRPSRAPYTPATCVRRATVRVRCS
ncbi:hypothetical protein GCM10010254_72170 [Streptomyces chromofuscus]|nr:hypothetical protein GCM10010254_72170 [Streptomyces chromofuscus]